MKKTTIIIFIALIAVITACNKSNKQTHTEPEQNISPEIQNNGEIIKIKSGSTDQIQSMKISQGNISSEIKAPCKIVIAAMSSNEVNSYLYDSNELSDIIAERLKTKNLIDKNTHLVERLKDLTEHHASPVKDLIDAETELMQLKTTLLSLENKLIVMGLNPKTALNLQSGKVLVLADVPELQIGKLRQGVSVKITFNSFPGEVFVNSVLALGNVVDPLTRTVKVQVSIDNKNGRLVPGLYGQMVLDVNDNSSSIVPVNSIFTAKGKSFLFVEKNPGEYHRREILIGSQNNEWVQVLKGIEKEEQVVTKGVMLLKSLSFGY
ncbi:MAG: efflux RND transporter periplasmic adaptor subunit [Candidatus Kapabacteria bacterium]|nr:efflux RND transporter periplasmic adaptor subunit [Candidatus Kapabacteria bacterium]